MSKDDSRSVFVQRFFNYFLNVDRTAVESSSKQPREGENSMPVIQEEADKLFGFELREMQAKECSDVSWAGQTI